MTEFAVRPAKIPTDRLPEASPALLRDGYRFISRRCDRLRTDVFGTRLLFEKTICMRGEAAARLHLAAASALGRCWSEPEGWTLCG